MFIQLDCAKDHGSSADPHSSLTLIVRFDLSLKYSPMEITLPSHALPHHLPQVPWYTPYTECVCDSCKACHDLSYTIFWIHESLVYRRKFHDRWSSVDDFILSSIFTMIHNARNSPQAMSTRADLPQSIRSFVAMDLIKYGYKNETGPSWLPCIVVPIKLIFKCARLSRLASLTVSIWSFLA